MKLRVGIIGCGRMASTIEDEVQGRQRGGLVLPYSHAGGYAVVEETEVVAACDVVEEKLGAVRAVVGGGGNSIGGHLLDTLLYLLGDPEPVSIHGTLGQLYPAEGETSPMRFVRDTPIRSALVEFANGATMHVAGAMPWG